MKTSAAPRPLRLPLIGEFPVNMQVQILAAAFLLFFIAATFVALQDSRATGNGNAQLAVTGEMRTLSQQLARAAQGGLTGQASAMADLRNGRDRFAQLLTVLTNGGPLKAATLPPLSPALYTPLEDLRAQWDQMDRNLQLLLAQEKSLTALGKLVSDITEQSPRAADLGGQAGGSLPLLVERIGRNATLFLTLTAVDEAPAAQLGKDINAAVEASAKLKDGELQTLLKGWQNGLQPITADIKPLLQAKQAAGAAIKNSSRLRDAADTLGSRLEESLSGRGGHLGVVATFGSAALLMLVLMVKVISDDAVARREEAERHRREAEAANAATQYAIARLIGEMANLADGDLTVRATVTGDVTASIAESLNYTIDQLSVLVQRINDAASRVTLATRLAADTTEELLAASDTQTDQIRYASGLVLSMAGSMNQMSEKARESAGIAHQSQDVAERGAAAVHNAIAGMNDMRQQIQETSKRIKRLGESSQEIGEIVELISDITEQTNVLALNAAIQAASAGEAGRGFSVVAEEVQRLAERSAEATKQIAALVRTIQADTHEAVAAMERTTQNVVEGARLSDATGQALAEISGVAKDLARLIEGVSGDTQRQSEVARNVAESMKEILRITEQTTAGTQQTANSIGDLTDLAGELKGSVAGFKV
ncbi:MAG: methyl-accepting chemotaxis protein [Rhodocyclaceae bacterium]|nr:MAG: methyl-accepting chemotaxis protein [Rhodocyclaceae bacterium]